MATHVKVLGVLYIVFGVMGAFAALMVGLAFGVAGVATAAGAGDPDTALALPIIGLTGTALVTFLLILSLPGIVAGIGLLQFRPWARILAIVLSALNLINFPFGTVVGIYGLYVLFSGEGARLFTQRAPA
jgi:hypothetical protein